MSLSRNTCIQCKKDCSPFDIRCYDCDKKNDRTAFWIMAGITLAVVMLLIGARFVWAHIAFKDWRCALAECRIIK